MVAQLLAPVDRNKNYITRIIYNLNKSCYIGDNKKRNSQAKKGFAERKKHDNS